jgi:flagellar biosynthetic protein FlhB
MAGNDAQDRNLPASAKKIAKARKDGQVPRSRDLGHFVAMGLAAALLFTAMPALTGYAQHLVADGLTFDSKAVLSPVVAGEHVLGLFTRGLMVVLICGGLFMAAGVASNVLFGGWNVSMKAVSPDFGRMNPISGIGRLFNKQHLLNVLKAVVLAIAVGATGLIYLKNHFAACSRPNCRPAWRRWAKRSAAASWRCWACWPRGRWSMCRCRRSSSWTGSR